MLLQYVCPSCGGSGHIRIDGSGERNANCSLCGWVGDSSTAADEADEKNRERKARKSQRTPDLVARLDALRDELGDAWQPGWRGVVDDEAASIIEELQARGTHQAREALRHHGIERGDTDG